LDFLWKFLDPILDEANQAKLRPASSADSAKKLAFHLYDSLGMLSQKTDAFVDALGALVSRARTSTPSVEMEAERNTLAQTARELMYALPRLAEALDGVNPQLDIHKHELVEKINQYRSSRALVLTELESGAHDASRVRLADLERILATAEKNRKLINEATAELRTFLAQVFPFKDSF
jgi:hypothetical protein